MIDGYKCRDGRVIVINYDNDNNVTEEEREYQDNIEELLKAENIEEYLDKLKDDYEKKIRESNKKYKSSAENISIMICSVIMFTLMFGLSVSLANSSFIPLIATFLGSSFVVLLICIPSIRNIRKTKKDISGCELALEGINEEIQKNQRELRRLRNDTRVEKEDISSEYRQFDLKPLEELDEYLKLWEYIGENEKFFVSRMEHGMIDKDWEDELDKSQIKALKRVLSKRNSK